MILIAIVFIILMSVSTGFSATHYIRDGGTASTAGTGSCNSSGSGSWSTANACDVLPATLVRGDTYYIADGTYAGYTFSTANSGTTLITIKKAVVADHGTSTGWLDTYGDGQAVFDGWTISTDYWLFDGQTRNSNWRTGAISQYGIRVKVTGDKAIRLDDGGGNGGDNLTFRYIDAEGGGRDTNDSNSDVIYGLTGNSNITFQYCALHDSDRTIFLMRGNWQNLTIEYCYIARNNSTEAVHGEMMSLTSATNLVIRYNSIQDTEGTAGLVAGLNDGDWVGGEIYGNTYEHTAAYLACTGRPVGACEGISAMVYVANDASNINTATNVHVYNNTFVHVQGLWSGIHIEAGSGNFVRNNIWYDGARTGGSGTTPSYNWYYNTVIDSPGSNDTTCTVSCNIFTNLSGSDFTLAAATSGGFDVGSPYNVDPSGVARGTDGTWDRGAFEYVTGGGSSNGSNPTGGKGMSPRINLRRGS